MTRSPPCHGDSGGGRRALWCPLPWEKPGYSCQHSADPSSPRLQCAAMPSRGPVSRQASGVYARGHLWSWQSRRAVSRGPVSVWETNVTWGLRLPPRGQLLARAASRCLHSVLGLVPHCGKRD